MVKEYRIAVLNGDGIGPEIMEETLKVARAVGAKYDLDFNMLQFNFGAKSYNDIGLAFPRDARQACYEADAVLKGPVGLNLKQMEAFRKKGVRIEDDTVRELRLSLDAYCGYRPVLFYESLSDVSPLKSHLLEGGLDILLMREMTGGLYFGNKTEGRDTAMKFAIDECKYTQEQVWRFAHACFREAEKRNEKRVTTLTNVHKGNVLATSRFWNDIFARVALDYNGLECNTMNLNQEPFIFNDILVDNFVYQLVKNPRQFNGVVALENMQGDIVSDLAGGIIGSLGLMPSGCINHETGKAYYEPSHGSAPDIAGKNIANPYSMIASFALMLDKSFGRKEESAAVFAALKKVFDDGFRTCDLATSQTSSTKKVSTSEFGDMVFKNIMGMRLL